jgi:Family of unknown function (DUF6056)
VIAGHRPAPADADPSASAASARPADLGRYLYPVLGGALLLPLLVYGAVGAYTRYAADDYCTAGIVRTQGLFGAQVWWYYGFSPRYAFSFVVSAVELLGLAVVPVLPALAMLAFWSSLAWTLTRFGAVVPRLRSWPASALLAQVIVFATLSTTPDLPQSLYWQTGMLTYLFPLVLLALYVGWVQTRVTARLRGRPESPLALLVSATVPFFAGGLSETSLALQGLALFMALVLCLLVRTPATRAALPHVLVGWAASCAALGVIQLSPTVAMREHGLKPPVGLALQAAANTGWLFVVRSVRHSLPTLLLCLAAPALVGVDSPVAAPRTLARWLGLGALATLVLVMGCTFPAFFAQGGDPPARSYIVPTFALMSFFVVAGVALAPLVRRRAWAVPRPALALAVACLALVPVVAAAQTLPDRAQAADYAARWDAEDQQIRQARAGGATSLVVPQLPRALGEPYVTTNARDWFNQCVARYYDLQSIVADQPPPPPD